MRMQDLFRQVASTVVRTSRLTRWRNRRPPVAAADFAGRSGRTRKPPPHRLCASLGAILLRSQTLRVPRRDPPALRTRKPPLHRLCASLGALLLGALLLGSAPPGERSSSSVRSSSQGLFRPRLPTAGGPSSAGRTEERLRHPQGPSVCWVGDRGFAVALRSPKEEQRCKKASNVCSGARGLRRREM